MTSLQPAHPRSRRRAPLRTVLVAAAALAALLPAAPSQATHAPYQGFGAATPGGDGKPTVRVTSLADRGPGTLREALLKGDRTIVFDVAGEIALASDLEVVGSFVTIDGLSAPRPGITLKGYGLIVRGKHDVIIRGLRIRNAATDGIQIAWSASSILVDHVSVQGSGDGNIDITQSARDVTVAWSILAEPAGSQKNMLIKYNPSRVSVHHNLFVSATQRNPQVRIDNVGTPATDTTLDMRNNVVWDWGGGYGTIVWYGPRANVVNNFYSSPASSRNDQQQAIILCTGQCEGGDPRSKALGHLAGNLSGDPLTTDLNAASNVSAPFPAPPVDTQSACEGARRVLSSAGVRPLDAVDQAYLSRVALKGCPDTGLPDLVVSALSVPASAGSGQSVSVSHTVENRGSENAAATQVRFYLSTNTTLGAADVVLGSRTVPPLGPGLRSAATLSLPIPAATPAGTYYVIARADAGDAVAEADETNNLAQKALLVTASAPAPAPPPSGTSNGADLTVASIDVSLRSLSRGATTTVKDTVKNRGVAVAAASTMRLFLSRDKVFGPGDVPLGSRAVPALAPDQRSSGTVRVTIPAKTAPGEYWIVAVADADNVVAEVRETNNEAVKSIVVR